MSCNICKPILDGEGVVEFDAGHSDYEKMSWYRHGQMDRINIYPKPYKPSKFYSIGIKYCPFCGTNLNSRSTWQPKTLRELEGNMELKAFEQKNLHVFKEISGLTTKIKELQEQEKSIKESLLEKMMEYDIKSLDNEYINITYVHSSEKVTIDLKELELKELETFNDLMKDYPVRTIDLERLEAAEPELYDELIDDYPKVSSKKAHLRFKVK